MSRHKIIHAFKCRSAREGGFFENNNNYSDASTQNSKILRARSGFCSLICATMAALISGNPALAANSGAVNEAASAACIDYIDRNEMNTIVYAQTTPCDGLTVRDVSAMDLRGRSLYLFGMAARPLYRIGQKAGPEALACLHGHFLDYPTVNGERQPPRGMTGLIRIIHRAANNGGLDDVAYLRVRNGVNAVAEKVCNVDTALLAAAPNSSR